MVKKANAKATKILNGRVTEDIYKKYEAQAKKERRKIGQLVTIVLEDATKTFTLSILLFFLMINVGKSQEKKPVVKDTLPKLEYNFKLDPLSYKFVDSILFNAYSKAGYPLLTQDGDRLRSGIASVIEYFRGEARKQDSIFLSKIKK